MGVYTKPRRKLGRVLAFLPVVIVLVGCGDGNDSNTASGIDVGNGASPEVAEPAPTYPDPEYASPEELWNANEAATEERDWGTVFDSATPDWRKKHASSAVNVAALRSKFGGDEGSSMALTHHRFTDTTDPAEFIESHQDLRKLFVDLMDPLTKTSNSGIFMMFRRVSRNRQLRDVVIDGDHATAVEFGELDPSAPGEEPPKAEVDIEFEKIGGFWFESGRGKIRAVNVSQSN